jgi:uncharacterized phosphosugar-binding protein
MGPDSTLTDSGTTTFIAAARAILDRIEAQAETLDRVSAACADAIAADGLVHLFGTGHSRIPVEEMFPRYGSYPGFNPIVELSMTFHTQVVGTNGQRQAMFIERVPGLAEAILANFDLRPTDVMIVFSAGGTSAVPIEMAIGGRSRGLTVVAVTSLEASGRLHELADLVVDLGTPAGDALVPVPGIETPVAPGSTLAAVTIVNEIKARTAALLVERGAMPPVLTSASLVGEQESARLFDAAYAEHARRYARSLRGATERPL